MAQSKTYQQLRQQAINILSGMSISGRHPQTTLDRVVRIFNRYAANIQAYFAKTGETLDLEQAITPIQKAIYTR